MAIAKHNDVELLWIKEVLDQHGEFVCDLLRESIEAKELINSGDLEDSIDYKSGMEGANPKVSISFLSYGRAIELNYHKKSKNTQKFLKPNTNAILWGIRDNKKKKKKKNTNWYSRKAYGTLNRLIAIIMYELTDQEISRLKGILEYQNLLKK